MSVKFKNSIQVDGSISSTNIANATTDTDKFLVSDSGTVKYRTATEVISDLGLSALYVPYTGATGNVDLGANTLLAKDLIINHSSGSGVAASITKNGSGEALTVIKGSGSGNAMSVTGGLTSLVNLSLSTVANATGDFLTHSGGVINKRTPAQVLSDIGGQAALTNPITGTGTTNYVPKFTGSTSLGNSQIFDDGTNVGIGTLIPGTKLDVVGGFNVRDETSTVRIVNSGGVGLIGTSTNHPLAIRTDNTERMRITSTGNVGIGTTNPTVRLDVSGGVKIRSAAPTLQFDRNGSYTWNLVNGDGVTYPTSTFNIANNAGTSIATFLDSGNVGIGTTSPGARLDVVGVFDALPARILRQATYGEILRIGRNGVSETASINYPADGVFAINTAGSERMRINASGNVGLGTSAPTNRLHVLGGILNGAVATFSGQNNDRGLVVSTFNSGNSDAGVLLNAQTALGVLAFATVGSERMRITSDGSVLINNTASYYGYQSQVRGAFYSYSTADDRGIVIFPSQGTPNIQGLIPSSGNANNIALQGSGGNVGIGTTSPTALLDIQPASGTSVLRVARTGGTDVRVAASITSTGGLIGTYTNSPFDIYTNSTSKVRVTETGNVGIGTTTPNTKLSVATVWSNGTDTPFISSQVDSETLNRIGTHVESTSTAATAMTFYTHPANNASSEKMRITSTGNVGIGTTNPSQKLEVIGSAKISQSLTIGTGGNYEAGTIYSDVNWGMIFRARQASPTNAQFMWADSLDNEFMRINTVGSVGIGTSNPTEKLTIAGGNISLGAGYKLQYSSTAYMTPENNVSGAEIATPGVFTIKTGGTSERVRVASTGALRLNSYGSGTFTGTATQKLAVDSSGNVIEIPIGAGPVDGSGTTNYITKWTDSDTIGNSIMFDNGTNVGIGTSSPTAKLSIGGVGSALSFDTLGASGTTEIKTIQDYELSIKNNRGTSTEILVGNEILKFSTSELERMRINSAGNVGIGTTTPGTKLEVAGTVLTTSTLGSTAGSYAIDHPGINTWKIGVTATNSSTFHIGNDTGGSFVNKILNITSAGNVGIGTTSPIMPLDVAADSGANAINIRARSLNDYGVLRFSNSTASEIISQIYIHRTGTNIGALIFETNNGSSVAERMRITSSGNVGIGTTFPDAKLDVNGDALINGLTIGRGGANIGSNTALGLGALYSNTTGEYNIAVGASANTSNNISGSTVIGVDLFTNPSGVSGLTSNSVAISQYNPDFTGTQYPHIYAPDKINCPNGDTTTDVLAIDYGIYTAAFIEYSIFNSDGDQFRAGTYTVAFKGTGTPVDDDKQTVVYSGTTLLATFNVSLSLAGSIATIQLRNQDSDTYDIRVTARLIMR
jgi:hypothetical protein